MGMTIRERLGEVAVIRALGFSPQKVALVLFGECALIGVLGGLLGAGVALWLFGSGMTLGAVLGGVGYLWVSPWVATEALGVAGRRRPAGAPAPDTPSAPPAPPTPRPPLWLVLGCAA